MLVKNIGKIEKAEFYLNVSLRHAIERANIEKERINAKDKTAKQKIFEKSKIKIFQKDLLWRLYQVIESFPDYNDLPEFYKQLIRATIDHKKTFESIKSLKSAIRQITKLSNKYMNKIEKSTEVEYVKNAKRAYFGRLSALVKGLDKDLETLDKSRKIMREFPTIKTGIFTVAIAGFPNVGKSTLLSKITTSKPRIEDYAFTTKSLNLGYIIDDKTKIQLIDTPGSLDRLEKMNNVERQAFIAIKYLANAIIYVFDPTESYDIEKQKELYNRISRFGKKIICYASKTDITKDYTKIKEYNPFIDPTELKKAIISLSIEEKDKE